jgi:hypothetical protein
MSKNKSKNYQKQVTTESTEEIVNETVEVPSSDEELVEESTDDAIEETETVEESSKEEVNEEPVDDNITNAITATIEKPVIKKPVIETPPENEVDPLPEKDGKFYISLGKDFNENKLAIISTRLERAGFTYIATATGEILVGPFVTSDDALVARKAIIAKGLKGTIITME